ncbi:MAG: spore maturation protein [Clostridia bacterium]|nr:spore maturation protein [Clostridia bacterium]MDY5555720.1 spore maturation protein [Blautia sp.]
MKVLSYISDLMIPFLMLYIIGYGILNRRDIYNDFLEGAKDGLKTVAGICPALIGLMTAVGILRASGFFDMMGKILGRFTGILKIPSEIIPLSIVRMFSSSAATGLLLDIFKQYGTDSRAGLMGAVIMSATESVFYCMSVYFASVKVEKTRYTLPGALTATAAGVAAAIALVNRMI